MNIIFFYGPPAVGKLTIATALAKRTGYKLLHNHMLVNPIAEVFPHDHPAHRLLVREFRQRIIEEAIKNNISLITTFGIAGNEPFSHLDAITRSITSHKGTLCLVHLTADSETILKRVGDDFRKQHNKLISKEKLQKMFDENDMFAKYPDYEHLTINTALLSPQEAVDKIVQYYSL